jgi:hypothetical protein
MSGNPVSDGSNRANGDQRHDQPPRSDQQPHRRRSGRGDRQWIFGRTLNPRFERRLSLAQSLRGTFDLGDIARKLVVWPKRRGYPTVRTANGSSEGLKLA